MVLPLAIIPTPNAAQYQAIRRWFWRTAISGYFSGWNTGMMSTDKAAVQDFADGKNGGIFLSVAKPNADIWTARTFRIDNAHAKLLAIILSYHQPIDLLTGMRVDTDKALAWVNAKEYHHFFPQEFLKRRGERANRINSLANIIMLSSASNKKISNKSPSVYLAEVAREAGPQLESWLASNLISMDAYEAALRDDFDAFLKLRSETIHNEVIRKAEW
jgi:hypothetical protein